MLGKPSRRTQRKLEEHGVVAPAVVVEIADGGMAVTNGAEGVVANTELIVKTRLRVEPAGAEPFEVTKRFRYPQLQVPSVGARIAVRYDPEDPDTLMIEPMGRDGVMPTGVLMARGGTLDLGGMLNSVRQAQKEHPGDPMAVAEAARVAAGIPASGGPAAFGMDPQALAAAMGGMAGMAGAPAAPAAQDPIAHLQRLAGLLADGVITQAEFDEQKQRLLQTGL
jgi:hypothetical protein